MQVKTSQYIPVEIIIQSQKWDPYHTYGVGVKL